MRVALHTKMLIGLAAGAAAGLAVHRWAGDSPFAAGLIRHVTEPAGQIFLRLLFMLVIPLLFSALVLGVSELGEVRRLGRVGLKTLLYTAVVSSIAVLLGVGLVNLLRPGDASPETREKLLAAAAERAKSVTAAAPAASGTDLLVQIIPDNPVKAAASGDYLAVMFFALMIGIGLLLVPSENTARFKEAVAGLYEISMRLIGVVISFAPYAVAAILFTHAARLGVDFLGSLGKFVGVAVLAMAIHLFGVYPLAVRLFSGMSPRAFFRGSEEAMLTAFSTASSNATLPTALRVAEEKLRLPPQISRFVLTIGATANQNGTALYEGVSVLFIAQFYGVELAFPQQALVVAVCILAGIGTAGIPGASLPVIAMLLGRVGVPAEGIGIILGADRFLDMCRTTLNVTGDLAAAAVVAGRERRAEAPAPA